MQSVRTGTCVRNAVGKTLSAVSWIDGKEVWVQITITNGNEECDSIILPGGTALVFASALSEIVPNAEVVQ